MSKLLMITGDRGLASGKQGAFYNTLGELHKYWDRIDIICPKVSSSQKDFFGNIYVHASPWPLIWQPFWILKKGQEIYKKESFDLMTVHEYAPFYNGKGARILHHKIKVPYILEVMHIPGYPKAGSLKESIYRLLTKWFIRFSARSAKAFRVINQHQTKDFLIQAGIPLEKIKYIPANYIDLDIFKPENIEKKFDLIFVGRLEKNKGIQLFVDALKQSGLKGIIVGTGPLKNSIKKSDNLIVHGWAKDSTEISHLMNQSRILVMPSYNEGGPRVVLEAMACGLPVLATEVGIVPDIMVEGKNGYVIDWDPDDIVKKAKLLLENYSKEECLNVASRFEKKAAVKNYADELKRLI